MSKKCELTGKSPLKGHKVSHANNKAKRLYCAADGDDFYFYYELLK